MKAEQRTTVRLGRPHKVLIGIVVAGALVIAGIGFAGSYAAVRELALKKGFRNFSYVFPIGIDAGIGVLLALDLLLTWIRIPFPMLRQTAWLLTVATIAFNGAAAWPDPLGVGMHAVIPILFVVSIEAARHAIGRIADITADKHMEGVRYARWLLSPIPTFLLWRRMKLWELRSYERAIRLEQDRLIYQARLHSRFGRAWRRKAPVESLMPLRLARYGVPLAETASAGLAAAGIEPAVLPPAPAPAPVQASVPAAPEARELEADQAPAGHFQQAPEQARAQARTRMQAQEPLAQMPAPAFQDASDRGLFADAYQSWVAQFLVAPTPGQFALFLRDRFALTTAAGDPLSDEQLSPILASLQQRYEPTTSTAAEGGRVGDDVDWEEFFYRAWIDFAQEYGSYPDAAALARYVFERDGITTAAGEPLVAQDLHSFVHAFQQRDFGDGRPPIGETVTELGETKDAPKPAPTAALPARAGTHSAQEVPGPKVNAAIDEQQPSESEDETLTVVDRYYLAWKNYQNVHGQEPTDKQLSTSLARNGVSGRSGNPVSPSTLRRYFLHFRMYHVWAGHRTGTDSPPAESVAQNCADRGITAQYNRPITTEDITKQADDFERRWRAIIACADEM